MTPVRSDRLRVAVVYPDLLGTYGDGGNGIVLARRAAWRGIDVELLGAVSGLPLPDADVYCLGGGEDGPEVRAAALLREDGTLRRAAGEGRVVLGVCAGYQLLGTTFPDAAGEEHEGLGLLDIESRKGSGVRAVGELVASVLPGGPTFGGDSSLPVLNGFENHGGVSTVGAGSKALARVVQGVGNGDGSRTEGAWSGRVLGTYLHGPVLARNVGLADVLLAWALESRGDTRTLEPLDDTEEVALRSARLAAAGGTRPASRPRPAPATRASPTLSRLSGAVPDARPGRWGPGVGARRIVRERPRPSPCRGVGSLERGRRACGGLAACRPPVGRDFRCERGDGRLDAPRESARVLPGTRGQAACRR